jgi:uncharacterized protein involved in outer membrane biogenesis
MKKIISGVGYALKWVLIGFLGLAFIIGLTLFVLPDTWLSHLASDKGSAGLGRTFAIEGPVVVHWDWKNPLIQLSKISLANSAGSKDPNMVQIEGLEFHLKIWDLLRGRVNIPDITLDSPNIILEKNADGQANWDFPTISKANAVNHAVVPSKRSNFPFIGILSIHNGKLSYHDATKGFDLTLGIDGAEGIGGTGKSTPFKLKGNGTLQGQKFQITANGGSLAMLRNSKDPYPLELSIDMGQTHVGINGTFTDPIKMSDLDATLNLSGDSLADLFYLTTIPLPPTHPYKLSGHLSKRDEVWSFNDFKGTLGQSDLSGNLSFDSSGVRGMTKAEFVSRNLLMSDLGGFVGENAGSKETPTKKADTQRVLPDVPLDMTRLRTSDLDIYLKAAHIEAPGWPLEGLDVRFLLNNGVLRLDPFSFGVAQGRISGFLVLDGSKDVPDVKTDLALQNLSLSPFFQDTRFASFSKGRFGGRIQVEGSGRTLADVLGDSNGRMTLLMEGGTVSKLIIDAAGLDFGKATPELLGKDQSTDIRCVIGDFGDKNGLLKSNIFVVDTTASNIQGNATISLKDETLNIKIEAHPKSVSLSARTPIDITGPFRSPSVGLDPAGLAERGVAAAALSIFTPLASIIPFIEPGLGKDSDCQHYVDEARRKSGAAAPPSSQ